MESLYQTESFLTACISLVHEPDKPWSSQYPSCTNSRKELRRCCSPIGHNNRKHFLCPIRSQHSLDRLEMVRWESVTQGLFRLYLKTFVAPFLPPDWLPLGLRGWGVPGIHSLLPLQAFYVNPARFALTKGPRSRRQFPILQLSW